METHNRAVAIIAAQARQLDQRNEPYRIYHGSTNTTRPSQRRRDQLIDTSNPLSFAILSLKRLTYLALFLYEIVDGSYPTSSLLIFN